MKRARKKPSLRTRPRATINRPILIDARFPARVRPALQRITTRRLMIVLIAHFARGGFGGTGG
jgi:hypothetical protein